MKLRNHSSTFFFMLLLGAAAFLSGCATTGMDRSVKTSKSIQEVDSELRKIVVQGDATAASLDSLVKAGQPDLKKSFNAYSHNLNKFDSDGKHLLKSIEEMKTRKTEYFAEWEKQGDAYKNPQIRQLSEERRVKLAESYAKVHTAGAGITIGYNAYLTDLREIQKYLSNDLTPKGVDAIAPVVNQSFQDLDVLKASVTPVLAALEEIKAELYGGAK